VGVPRCGQCGRPLEGSLAHRVLRSTAATGEQRDLLVAYCAGCGSAVAAT
jgi:ribosomal protein L34E